MRYYPYEDSVYISWSLPSSYQEIELIRFGIGPIDAAVEDLPLVDLYRYTRQYTAQNLEPGTSYTIVIYTENYAGRSAPVTRTVETESLPEGITVFVACLAHYVREDAHSVNSFHYSCVQNAIQPTAETVKSLHYFRNYHGILHNINIFYFYSKFRDRVYSDILCEMKKKVLISWDAVLKKT